MGNIELLHCARRAKDTARDAWLRRQAIQIASQLPESGDEAMYVLEYAKTIVSDFLAPKRFDSCDSS